MTPTINSGEVTQLLQQWRAGDSAAFDAALDFVYAELHRSARRFLSRGGSNTLQPTALIHELYLRLAGDRLPPQIRDRRHFLALSAKVMRRILVDRAREHKSLKRGGGVAHVPLEEHSVSTAACLERFLGLDQAIDRLSESDAEMAMVIELRYYGGLEIQEAAEVLGISNATVVRRQRAAEAWLARELSSDAGRSGRNGVYEALVVSGRHTGNCGTRARQARQSSAAGDR